MSEQDFSARGEAQSAYAIGDTPVNPYTLISAVNDTSELAHTGWLVFLGVVAYFCIAVAGVTHKDLLLNSAVELPVMQVSIDLTRFFLFAPILLVFLHFGLLVQHVMLARKVLEFDAAVRQLEATDRRTHPLRLELHSYYFTQQLAGPDRSPVLGGFLHGMFWLTAIGLPILVILYIQLVFLPYHDVATTWAQRAAVLADAGLLLIIGVFLGSRSTSFFRAFGRTARFQPVSFVLTGFLIIGVALFSVFVATIPDESLDRFARSLPGATVEADTSGTGTRAVFVLTAMVFDSVAVQNGKPRLFRRNLVVTDENVIERGGSDGKNKRGSATEGQRVSLRGRDLRYAVLDRSVLHDVDFTGADLEGASLVRTDLSGARLSCTDIDGVLKKTKSKELGCTVLERVALSGAILQRADLRGAIMPGAKLDGANLNDADLRFSDLTDADLSGAQLRRAALSGGAVMIGANFLGAQMQGADLTGAKMHGADLSGAGLQGAQMSFVQAYGASFQSADLDGALLNAAKLQGADFSEASLPGADFGASSLWLTLPPKPDKVRMAELSQIKVKPLELAEMNALQATMDGLNRPKLRSRLDRTVGRLLDANGTAGWQDTPEGQVWTGLKARSAGVDPSGYRMELSEYLARLACEARAADGAVAAGLIRRELSPTFKGDVRPLLARLRGPDCPAARNVPEEQILRLAAAAELAAARQPVQAAEPSGDVTAATPNP